MTTLASFFPFRVVTAVALVTISGAGMGCDEVTTPGVQIDGGGGASTAESIVFQTEETLQMAPGSTEALRVQVLPGGFHTVKYSVLAPGTATKFDGFLSAASSTTTVDGGASVSLTAPTEPSTFMVRASVGDELSAVRAVSVSDGGFASVRLTPRYTGKRSIDAWTASATAGISCSALNSFFVDGPLVAQGAEDIVISAIPVGPSIALVVRGGDAASGCVTLMNLSAGESRTLTVDVADRPLRVDDGTLTLSLDATIIDPAFQAYLKEGADALKAGFFGVHDDDAELLLQQMGLEITDELKQGAFKDASQAGGFLTLIQEQLGEPHLLRDHAHTLALSGADGLIDGPLFSGALALAGPISEFKLIQAGGVPAERSGFLIASDWSVEVDAGDRLFTGGTLSFERTRFLASRVEQHAETNGGTPEASLADVANCETIASELASAAGGQVYPSCNQTCTERLCEKALASLWRKAAASEYGLTSILLAVSGAATVDDQARPSHLDGTWVGNVSGDAGTLSGNTSGELK